MGRRGKRFASDDFREIKSGRKKRGKRRKNREAIDQPAESVLEGVE